MKVYLVITVTCPDRPGIVERITDVIADHSGNWEESRMARLGGDFAGIVMVSVDGDRAPALSQALQELQGDGMAIGVKQTDSSPAVPDPPALYELRLVGADHEGIVHAVASYLAQQGVNLESMETTVTPAPMSATPMFHMTAQVTVDSPQLLQTLQAELQSIGDQAGADIELCPRGNE